MKLRIARKILKGGLNGRGVRGSTWSRAHDRVNMAERLKFWTKCWRGIGLWSESL